MFRHCSLKYGDGVGLMTSVKDDYKAAEVGEAIINFKIHEDV